LLLSVIIPTCNRNDLLGKCLEKLRYSVQQLPQDKYEVIVTDDSKENVAKSFIEDKYPWVKWVAGPKRGPAANRNNGVQYAQGEWLVFTDDDCLPANDWLASYRSAITTNVNDVFEGKTIPDRDQERFNEHSPINIDGGNLWSCNFAIRKDFFLKMGGFDENFPFPAMEDNDLFLRVQQVSKVCFVSEAMVVHPWRVMLPFTNYKKWLVSHQYFCEKHGIKRNLAFRWSRTKILVNDTLVDLRKLIVFKLKGTLYFFEKIIFNFLMIVK
jgi:GT2 family glycosyltransferase